MRTALIVDPALVNRMALRRLLRGAGFQRVLECADGVEAVALLSAELVDLVLMAWEIEGLSGMELLNALRARRRRRPPAVVLIDEGLQQPTVVAAIKAGASGRLRRPWEPARLLRMLSDLAPQRVQAPGPP